MLGTFRKIGVHALAAQMQALHFVEICFIGPRNFIVTIGLLSHNLRLKVPQSRSVVYEALCAMTSRRFLKGSTVQGTQHLLQACH
jgi:hypothetical protein